MRLVILGAGAIGGIVAAHLARAKRATALIARGAQLAAIREHGLRVETPAGAFVEVIDVHDVATRFDWRAGDVLAIATKTQDAAAALRQAAAPRDVPVLCLTNGVETERLALRHADHVYGCYVRIPGTYLVPGTVEVAAAPTPGMLDVGRYPDGIGDHADEIAGELSAARFTSLVRPSIMKWKRHKLLANLANVVEALCGPDASTSDVVDAARAEGRAVYAAAGLSCASDAEAKDRTDFSIVPIAGVARAGGSTWQSLARGAPDLETDYLNGEIAMLGRLHGVPTPVNVALQALGAQAVRERRAPGSMSLDELRSLASV